ncbi:hypothetical protein D4764_04G0001200 [Takifugu flavidus]|uniref:Uncharacterized protein n=1 Tax=Takifugu flavidus TaxID=433684 RepID=A0A5C6N2P9_9TELE|nr:hypothetical protein D4764_04G0001200 [Takifugu flavidus]
MNRQDERTFSTDIKMAVLNVRSLLNTSVIVNDLILDRNLDVWILNNRPTAEGPLDLVILDLVITYGLSVGPLDLVIAYGLSAGPLDLVITYGLSVGGSPGPGHNLRPVRGGPLDLVITYGLSVGGSTCYLTPKAKLGPVITNSDRSKCVTPSGCGVLKNCGGEEKVPPHDEFLCLLRRN